MIDNKKIPLIPKMHKSIAKSPPKGVDIKTMIGIEAKRRLLTKK